MSQETIALVHKLDDIPKKRFDTILPREHMSDREREAAADLLDKLLNWVPKKRISCE